MDKAGDMLAALSPLYNPDYGSGSGSRPCTEENGGAHRMQVVARSSAGSLTPAPQLSELVSPGAVMDYFGRPSGGAEFTCGVAPGLPTPPPSAIAGGGDEDVAVWGASVGFGQGE
ncbi:hypothetical protein DFH11DRAFT_1731429 [Phellopilus nigrolimitatus]|nr:hypothetical protein DFH11DRAFT_1731429 [Phellopilus nigrolimitatus]